MSSADAMVLTGLSSGWPGRIANLDRQGCTISACSHATALVPVSHGDGSETPAPSPMVAACLRAWLPPARGRFAVPPVAAIGCAALVTSRLRHAMAGGPDPGGPYCCWRPWRALLEFDVDGVLLFRPAGPLLPGVPSSSSSQLSATARLAALLQLSRPHYLAVLALFPRLRSSLVSAAAAMPCCYPRQ